MWKLSRSRVLLDEPPEEEDGLQGGGPPAAAAAAAAQVQGASFRGWKEVTSLFNKDDEQHLLERCKSPKSKGTNLRLREELKTEKKPGFWDNLVLKQNIQSKKPDEIEGWEPPKLALEDVTADPPGDAASGRPPRPGWEEDSKSCSKYSSLASSGNSSRWSLRSAGKLGLRLLHRAVYVCMSASPLVFPDGRASAGSSLAGKSADAGVSICACRPSPGSPSPTGIPVSCMWCPCAPVTLARSCCAGRSCVARSLTSSCQPNLPKVMLHCVHLAD
uniref:Testis development related protein n=1 Tax=Canis lupus familiaris TaxID=9615 RepID=A0A8C0RTC4_CANLF